MSGELDFEKIISKVNFAFISYGTISGELDFENCCQLYV